MPNRDPFRPLRHAMTKDVARNVKQQDNSSAVPKGADVGIGGRRGRAAVSTTAAAAAPIAPPVVEAIAPKRCWLAPKGSGGGTTPGFWSNVRRCALSPASNGSGSTAASPDASTWAETSIFSDISIGASTSCFPLTSPTPSSSAGATVHTPDLSNSKRAPSDKSRSPVNTSSTSSLNGSPSPAPIINADTLTAVEAEVEVSVVPPVTKAPCPPSVAQHVCAWASLPFAAKMLFRSNCAQLYAAGIPLGEGGEGQVRKIELSGHSFAVKRTDEMPLEYGLEKEGVDASWVQLPLAVPSVKDDSSPTGEYYYALYNLAAGDLGHTLTGQWAAAAGSVPSVPSVASFRTVSAEALVALDSVHTAGWVHGDIKPANILVGLDNHVMLADLGMARSCDMADVGGTPGFMAPEQVPPCGDATMLVQVWECFKENAADCVRALLKVPQDRRSGDIWSLAVTWMCLLAPTRADAEAALAFSSSRAAAANAPWWVKLWRRCFRGKRRSSAVAPVADLVWLPAELAPLLIDRMMALAPSARPTVAQLKQHPFFSGVDFDAVASHAVPLPVDLVSQVAQGRAV